MSLEITGPTMRQWWDIYWFAVWEGQETLRAELRGGDSSGTIGAAKGSAKKMLRQHDKLLKKRRPFQKRFHKQLQGFFGDTPAMAFSYGGINIDPHTHAVSFSGTRPCLVLANTATGDQVEMTARDEIEGAANFILFYRSQAVGDAGEAEDPDVFVRAVLESRGITAENYWTHPESPKDMIKCPFPTPRLGDEKS